VSEFGEAGVHTTRPTADLLITSPTRHLDAGEFGLLCTLMGAMADTHMNAEAMRGSEFGERLLPGPMLAAIGVGLHECSEGWRELVAGHGLGTRWTMLSATARFRSAATPGTDLVCRTHADRVLDRAMPVLVLEDTISDSTGRVLLTNRREVTALPRRSEGSDVTRCRDLTSRETPRDADDADVPVAVPLGRRFQTYGRTLSALEIDLLSDLTVDWQPEGRRARGDATVPRPVVAAIGAALAVYGSDLHRVLEAECHLSVVAALDLGARIHRDVMVGDTLVAETWIDSARPSASRPGCAVIVIRDEIRNQVGDIVADLSHTLLMST
jgi:acyl dehydratase